MKNKIFQSAVVAFCALLFIAASTTIPQMPQVTTFSSDTLVPIAINAGVPGSYLNRTIQATNLSSGLIQITAGTNIVIGSTGIVYTIHSSTSGGGGTPATPSGAIQFEDGGNFGGDAGATYNKTTDVATIAGGVKVSTGGQFGIAGGGAWLFNDSTTDQAVLTNANLIVGTGGIANQKLTIAGAGGSAGLRSTWEDTDTGQQWSWSSGGSGPGFGSGAFVLRDSTLGTNRLWIGTAGLIGVNNTAPASQLDIKSSVSGVQRFARTTGSAPAVGYEMGTSSTPDFGLYDYGNSRYIWRNSGAQLLLLEAGGGVTIGSSVGTNMKLEINDAAGYCLRLQYNDSDGFATTYADFAVTSDGNLFVTNSGNYVKIAKDLTVSGSQTNLGITASRFVTTDANNKLVATGTSSALASTLSDETGSGAAVFGTSPSITTPGFIGLVTGSANASFDTLRITNSITNDVLTASRGVFTGANKELVSTAASAALSASLSDETGSGVAVFATSPTLVTPVLGVATATSVNKVTLTQPATGSTLTILDGKTLTANKTITLDGTDGTTQTFPATSGTVFSSVTKADVLEAGLYAADAGANDTYTATLSPAITAYVTGTRYSFKANTANTGAASINFNGVGAVAIKKAAGGITTDLSDTDIRAGQIVDVVYDGTNMQMQSARGNGLSFWQTSLIPESAILSTTAGPSIGLTISSGTGAATFRTLNFNQTTDNVAYWTIVTPSDMASGSWVFDISWYANNTSANADAIWAVAISATATGDGNLMTTQAVDTFATVASVASTTANALNQATITLTTTDSVAAGSVVTIAFLRDADDSLGNADDDSLAMDAKLVAVRVKIPRN